MTPFETFQVITTIGHALAFLLWLGGFAKMMSMTRDNETQKEIDYLMRRFGEELHRATDLTEQNIKLKYELDRMYSLHGRREKE